MSTIGGIGQSAAALASIVSSAGAGAQASASDAGPSNDLLASLQRDIDYAFKNGKSLDEIGQWLNRRVSATLQNHGVADDDRQAILDHMRQILAEGGSQADARQSVTTYLQQVADYIDPTATAAASTADPASAPLGQSVDFTA